MKMMKMLRIRKGDDFHCHFRAGKILQSVLHFTAWQFKRAIVMPNTSPRPVLTDVDAIAYKSEITNCHNSPEPLMTIQITDQATQETVIRAKLAGVVAGKIYPQGVTTNSQNGVSSFKTIYPALEAMQAVGMLALFHGEDPDQTVCCLDREKFFLPTLYQIICDFPRLKIVLEHITTRDAVEFVERMPQNISATITAHHLAITIDDVIGGLIQPHNFCKPIAKRNEDKRSLLEAATSGNPKFFFGSDSAPHLKNKKECASGCAGVFSAPLALPLLTQIFEERNALGRLEDFVATHGANFYGLVQNHETVRLVKKDWTVPEEINGIVPFMAGQTLHWSLD